MTTVVAAEGRGSAQGGAHLHDQALACLEKTQPPGKELQDTDIDVGMSTLPGYNPRYSSMRSLAACRPCKVVLHSWGIFTNAPCSVN